MKLIVIPLFSSILLITSCVEKQKYFVGQIEYSYSYESIQLNTDSLTALKPYKGIFRYDINNYQSQFIGQDIFTYCYASTLNICVSETNSKKDYECEDYGIPTDSIISFNVYDTDEKVMGHHCKIVEYQSKRFWNRYFVSTDLKIAPGTYQKHLAYNWKFYGEKADGGLILKLEHRFKNYTMRGFATSVNQQNKNYIALQLNEKTISAICNTKN